MIDYGEMQFGNGVAKGRNPITGRFVKGYSYAPNKGKKWDDYMPKRSQRRSAKGWKNLEKHRHKGTSADQVNQMRKIIAIYDDGRFRMFPSIALAATKAQADKRLVCRCCQFNEQRRVNKRNGKINTDYRCNGVRYYYEDDDIWQTKIQV